jgi:mono/diheme cytochrome c family protein
MMGVESKLSAYPLWLAILATGPLLWPISPAAPAPNTPTHSPAPILSPGFTFAERSGEELYANVCQGCHMVDGKGASGAATYPSIANDTSLEQSGYPLAVVVNGQKAMPPFGAMMNDDQVAAVVNYVRTHFGNHYQAAVTAAAVKAVRR